MRWPWSPADAIRVIHRDEGHVGHNVKQLEIDATQVELGGFPHYMLKEIFEQPETVQTRCAAGSIATKRRRCSAA